MNLINAFKKKDTDDVPDVSSMLDSGMSQQDIIDNLRQQGYDSTAIKNALLNGLKKAQEKPAQTSQEPQPAQIQRIQIPQQLQENRTAPNDDSAGISGQTLENIQQILEQIIDEKWKSSASELNSLKSNININTNSIETINDQLERLNQRMDSLQNTMAGKTEEYNKTISDVNVELQAFEKVIDRLVPAISDSIKELRDLIDGMKTQKSA